MNRLLIPVRDGIKGRSPSVIERNGERWYTDSAVGMWLGVTRQTAHRWCRLGKISSFNQSIDDISLEVRKGWLNGVHYVSERTVESIMDIRDLRGYYKI